MWWKGIIFDIKPTNCRMLAEDGILLNNRGLARFRRWADGDGRSI